MAAGRNVVALQCTVCKNQNYFAERGKKKGDRAKIEVKKFCQRCDKHSLHKETKL
jgi:large subunit ribosomal protein L33